MFIRVPTYILFSKLLIISQCAPKLGPVLFDPLTQENDGPVYELPPPLKFAGTILRDLRKQAEANTEAGTRVPCNGYEFDDQKCKLINNRILCGYNKNVGEIKNKALTVDMGNGCRMRDDRIECGYVTGPFEGIRRPSLNSDTKTAMRLLKIGTVELDYDSPIMEKIKAVSKITPSPPETISPRLKLTALLLPTTNQSNIVSNISNDNFAEPNTTETITKISDTIPFDLNIITCSNISNSESTTTSDTIPTTDNSATTSTAVIANEWGSSSEFLENEIAPKAEATETTTKIVEATETKKENKMNVTSVADPESKPTIQTPDTELTVKTSQSINRIKVKRRSASENKTQPMKMTMCVEKQDRIVCYDEHLLPKNIGVRTKSCAECS